MSSSLRRTALGNSPLGRFLRWLYWAPTKASLPVPGWFAKPFLWLFLFLRAAWHWFLRVFVAEPFFRAYCTRYGKRLRTGPFVHWIRGPGRILVGDDVLVDGKCSIKFGFRFDERPTLVIGDRSSLGHACSLTIAKEITIGTDCRIAAEVRLMDSHGHPSDPERRRRGDPPDAESIKPVVIEDNVWIGTRSIIFPGVRIGSGSIVSAGSVVLSDVPANTIVAGNPARKIGSLVSEPQVSPGVTVSRMV